MTGLIGFSSGYYAMLDCDVLLMLGTDFPYRQFYPQGSGVQIAQIDIRAEQIGRRAAVDLAVVGDVRATIEALLPLLQQKRDATHLTQAQQHYTIWHRVQEPELRRDGRSHWGSRDQDRGPGRSRCRNHRRLCS